jgi:CYTH domain-containing protein
MSFQRLGKYACLEIERRYLLKELPPGLIEQDYSWHIVDRYILNTRLRVRRMASPSNRAVVLKLGQKYREAGQDPTQTTMTNIYLDEREYACLSQLEAKELVKKHYRFEYEGRIYTIEVFEGPLQGLILAEIEAETAEELAALPFPAFAFKDVTNVPFFTGGFLATLTEVEFRKEFAKQLSL